MRGRPATIDGRNTNERKCSLSERFVSFPLSWAEVVGFGFDDWNLLGVEFRRIKRDFQSRSFLEVSTLAFF